MFGLFFGVIFFPDFIYLFFASLFFLSNLALFVKDNTFFFQLVIGRISDNRWSFVSAVRSPALLWSCWAAAPLLPPLPWSSRDALGSVFMVPNTSSSNLHLRLQQNNYQLEKVQLLSEVLTFFLRSCVRFVFHLLTERSLLIHQNQLFQLDLLLRQKSEKQKCQSPQMWDSVLAASWGGVAAVQSA